MLGIHADFAGSGSVRAVTSRFRRSITGWVPLYHAVVVAHPRHLQPTPFLQDPVPHHYPHDMEDIEEIFWRAAEVEPQIKGI